MQYFGRDGSNVFCFCNVAFPLSRQFEKWEIISRAIWGRSQARYIKSEKDSGCSFFSVIYCSPFQARNKSALPGQTMDESVHLLASQSHASHVKKKKTFGSAAVTPPTKKAIKLYWKAPAECMQAAAVFQESAVAGSWQRPAVDWCYSHVEAFKKIRFPTQNMRSLMDCSQLCTFMGVGAEGIPPSSRPPLYSMHAMVWWKVSLKSHEWIMVQVACVLFRCVCGASTAQSFGSQGKTNKRNKKRCVPKVVMKNSP